MHDRQPLRDIGAVQRLIQTKTRRNTVDKRKMTLREINKMRNVVIEGLVPPGLTEKFRDGEAERKAGLTKAERHRLREARQRVRPR